MRRRPALAATLLLAAAAGRADAAGPDVEGLLGRLGGPAASPGSVEALAWVEPGGEGANDLVVTLRPRGRAKLVADPGVSATPVPAPGIVWADLTPATAVDSSAGYFAHPPILRLPFAGAAASASAKVEYAWCIVDAQCLFGEAVVTAPVPAAGG